MCDQKGGDFSIEKDTKMSQQEIKVSKRNQEAVVLNADLPETLEEFGEKFGDEWVVNRLKSALSTDLQNQARIHFDEGKEKMQAAIDAYVPGQRSARGPRDPMKSASAALAKLDPTALEALLQQIKEKIAAANA